MSASNRRVGDLITEIEEGKLNIRPYFQRRLVWTNTNKEKFVETVLKEYPFPEIFVGTGHLDLATLKRVNWLVDGQQRISTLREYVRGSPDILCKTIPSFAQLEPDQKTRFLDYEVAVRDLGTIGEVEIKEIFQRINSTDYALKSMERLNAMFSGAYNKYCEQLSRHDFFVRHEVFYEVNRRRMYDVTFCVILVTTMLAGYYRRDEKNKEYLRRYNDEFPQRQEVTDGLETVFRFLDACELPAESRAWKQTDLFTLLVELHAILVIQKKNLDAPRVGQALDRFFTKVDHLYSGTPDAPSEDRIFRYLKAATKATNDKYTRVERAEILSGLILDAEHRATTSAVPDPLPDPR